MTDYTGPPSSSYQPGSRQSAPGQFPADQPGQFPADQPGQFPADQPGGSTTAVARDQAAAVGQSASEAGSRVTQTATDQAREVVSETARQARDLLGEAGGQVRDQGSVQQQKAAGQLRSVADELHEMVAKGGQSGLATEVAQQAADRLHGAASWLEQREPADILQAVRNFARRRPGVFLAGAVAAGLAAGRLTRGMTDAARSGGEPGYPADAAPGATTGVVTPGAAAAEPYYPAAGVPGPGAAGPTEGIAPGRFRDSDAYPDSGYPDSAPETYRPGQQP